MSQNIGTLISAPIRPNDSNDLIASAWAKEINCSGQRILPGIYEATNRN